jgi:hypothetical protein
MKNQNQNYNDRNRSSQNPGMNTSSNTNSEQNANNPSMPEGGNWPKDETLKQYLKKDRKSKMKPGSLDRE